MAKSPPHDMSSIAHACNTDDIKRGKGKEETFPPSLFLSSNRQNEFRGRDQSEINIAAIKQF